MVMRNTADAADTAVRFAAHRAASFIAGCGPL